ncbi:MAG: MutS-related protein [bacterium]
MNDKCASSIRLIRRINQKLKGAEIVHRELGKWRFILFGLTVLFILIASFQSLLRSVWYGLIFIFLCTYILVVIRHEQLKQNLLRIRLWKKIKEINLARITLEWDKIPYKEYHVAPHHPYARDLDIIGKYSLLQLLDTTISSQGKAFLMDWLLYPEADLKKLKKRQRLVQVLKERILLRDKLTLEALCISEDEINGEKLMTRLRNPTSHWFPRLLKVEIIFWLSTVLLCIGWYRFSLPPLLWGISYLVYFLIFLFSLPLLAPIFTRSASLLTEFKKLKAIFFHLKKRSGEHPALAQQCAPLRSAENDPFSYLKRASRICDALSIQANTLIHFGINLLFPWDFFFVCRWEKLRRQMLTEIPLWLDTLGEIEAISALANFGCNNPDFIIPYLKMDQEKHEVFFSAESLGHPALPKEKRKTNNFELKGLGSLALITGSNMSGKSTFLKTIGINLCLAHAGGFVCASSLRSSWFRIFGCLRVDDSVSEGLSYFYAEVKRLKAILNAAEDWSHPPLLVLIDEIFKGTNNRERVIGGSYYLLKLTQNNLLGLVTTHDLEITKVSQLEKEKIINYHFQESIENKYMKFDYQLRPGVCPTTNALKILEIEGLPVPGTESGPISE